MADFVWPASPKGYVSSRFGRRKSPGGVGSTNHRGIDIAGATYILAAAPGTVTLCGFNAARGYYMTVTHGNGRKTLYQHIRKGGYLVGNGQRVVAGQKIALVGATGHATGPHLHFEVHINGAPVNPLNYSYGTYVAQTSTAAAAASSTAARTAAVQSSVAEAVKIVHVPQTEKLYTVYESDSPGKAVDRYAVTWQSLRTGAVRDITARTGGLTLRDDAASLCLELSFQVMEATDERFVTPLEIGGGDYVAVVNHGSGACVFLGQVQTVEGSYRDAVTVTCLDGGRALTANEIILQCNNVAAKTAIQQAAAKAGVKTVSCPNLISSVYNICKDTPANIIRDILDTVTAENGVDYFPRMMGETLVIRSYGATAIRGYCRQADNVKAFDIFDEAGSPTFRRSIADLRNAVTVYSEADSSVSVKATAEDADSIRLYGRRQTLETWTDQDAAAAAAKARTTLDRLNREDEEITLVTYGSDAIVAGCRVSLDLPEAKGDYWVISVEHEYGPPHMMTLTLRRAT